MNKLLIVLFAVMCVAQWIIPAKMVYESENTIAAGDLYKFKTEPIDPSDPFRGKYIILNFEADFIEFTDSTNWQEGQEVFVTFASDPQGYAVPLEIHHDKPASGNYLRTSVRNVNHYQNKFHVQFDLPFDRFYLEESKASEAEQLYWQALRDTVQVAYGLVSIGKGQAVLQNVFVNDKPIVDIINENRAIPEQ